MNRAVASSVLLACSVVMLSAAGPPVSADATRTASGLGNIHFGEEGTGIGLFDFNIDGGPEVSGRLIFAGEDHHHYPDIVIQAEKITAAKFSYRKVEFKAEGMMHDEPVKIAVIAFDGAGTSRPDHLSIKVLHLDGDDGGHGDFHAEGDVYKGDIQLGSIN